MEEFYEFRTRAIRFFYCSQLVVMCGILTCVAEHNAKAQMVHAMMPMCLVFLGEKERRRQALARQWGRLGRTVRRLTFYKRLSMYESLRHEKATLLWKLAIKIEGKVIKDKCHAAFNFLKEKHFREKQAEEARIRKFWEGVKGVDVSASFGSSKEFNETFCFPPRGVSESVVSGIKDEPQDIDYIYPASIYLERHWERWNSLLTEPELALEPSTIHWALVT